MGRRVLVLRSKSPAGIEPRIDKEATALSRAGYDVSVYLWDRRCEFPRSESRDGYRITRLRRRGSDGGPGLAGRAQLGDATPRRLVEVMNVPEERAFPPKRGTEFVVFYGGMIARDRGLTQLVAACEDSGAKLVVAGHGPDEGTLLPRIESSPAARFLGNVPYAEG